MLCKFHLHLKKKKSKLQIKSAGFKEASFFQIETEDNLHARFVYTRGMAKKNNKKARGPDPLGL